MVIKYHISPAPDIYEPFVVRIWESQSDGPTSYVWEQEFAEGPDGGHPTETTVTASGLDFLPHIVRLYTKNSAALLHEYELEPEVDTVTMFDPIRFKIGDGGPYTPASGSQTYANPLLEGLEPEDYEVWRNNYGLLFPAVHYVVNVDNGQWQLVGGDQFGDDEEFSILRKSKNVTTYVNDSVVGKWFGGFVDIAATRNFDPSDLRKLIRFTQQVSYRFAFGQTIPIGYAFVFQNFSDNKIGHIDFLNAPVKYGAANIGGFDVPTKGFCAVVFDGSFWNIIYASPGIITPSPTIPIGTILYVGELTLGNVPSEAWLYDIVHNQNIQGDYTVLMSIKDTQTTAAQDTAVTLSWRHSTSDKPNRFFAVTREYANGVNNLTISYVLIKA